MPTKHPAARHTGKRPRRDGPPGGGAPAAKPKSPPGLLVRDIAAAVIAQVLAKGSALDDALSAAFAAKSAAGIEPRDRALVRMIVGTVLRRHGELDAVLEKFLAKPIPDKSGRMRAILLSGAAQLLILKTPPHAAISLSVDLARLDHKTAHLDKLTNAVLRRVASDGPAILEALDPIALNTPRWMLDRWKASYGDATARRIAEASAHEAALDLTVKTDAVGWASRLGGYVLPSGSVRLAEFGRIEELAGYDEGAWWVQDATAALPARLLGVEPGMTVADLCAAPGGKTAQLAAFGARVTAVDLRPERLQRVTANLHRLKLDAECVVADATIWSPGLRFDAVLLDAPCSATGTIRRHPDILHLKRPGDLVPLARLQASLLDHAAELVKPGGRLVYCTCSLEPEEGEAQIAAFLARAPNFTLSPVTAGEAGLAPEMLTPSGMMRTLPFHMPLEPPLPGGLDGFFAARLVRGA